MAGSRIEGEEPERMEYDAPSIGVLAVTLTIGLILGFLACLGINHMIECYDHTPGDIRALCRADD